MYQFFFFLFALTAYPWLLCQRGGVVYQQREYTEDTTDFINPERGFYKSIITYTRAFEPLRIGELNRIKEGGESEWNDYYIKSSLIFRHYVLDNFRDKALSDDVLRWIDEDFKIARTAGVKIILRFSYRYIDYTHPGDDFQSRIFHPYGDAPKSIILQHIRQLKPVFFNNADVIYAVQEGFIGIWGEGYYTDYFGSVVDDEDNKLSDQNWNDRNEVLQALIDNIPSGVPIQVRTPQTKQRLIAGIHAPISTKPMSLSMAYKGTPVARIGVYNDCFLSSPSDFGTYDDYGNGVSASVSDSNTNQILKSYLIAESKYVPMGGESCSDQYAPLSQCDYALQEMTDQHFDYLNSDFHYGLITKWKNSGCLQTIKKKLGYRFVLKRAYLPARVPKGTRDVDIRFSIKNAGFSSVYAGRPVQIIFLGINNGHKYKLTLQSDIKDWYPGEHHIEERIVLPENMVSGKYRLFLNIPDGHDRLSFRPEYSIRLANNNIWDATTGYNDLKQMMVVEEQREV